MRELTKVGVATTSELGLHCDGVRNTLLHERLDDTVSAVGNLVWAVQGHATVRRGLRVGVEEGVEVANATRTRVAHTENTAEFESLTNSAHARDLVAEDEGLGNQHRQRRVEVVGNETDVAVRNGVQRVGE